MNALTQAKIKCETWLAAERAAPANPTHIHEFVSDLHFLIQGALLEQEVPLLDETQRNSHEHAR